MLTKYILINGNPAEGHVFTGPFCSSEDAIAYAEMTGISADWWITNLENPNDQVDEDAEHEARIAREGR